MKLKHCDLHTDHDYIVVYQGYSCPVCDEEGLIEELLTITDVENESELMDNIRRLVEDSKRLAFLNKQLDEISKNRTQHPDPSKAQTVP